MYLRSSGGGEIGILVRGIVYKVVIGLLYFAGCEERVLKYLFGSLRQQRGKTYLYTSC